MTIDPAIRAYYERGNERQRLAQGRSRLEAARTRELLAGYLPPPPARVLDVGGGSGPYALWLAGRGYDVHLVDPVPLHIEQAIADGARTGVTLASAAVGDARALDHADVSVDAVLLLGPLYHLTEREDRLLALREAARVLRPGGVACVVGISRFASLLDGLASGLLDDPAFAAIVEQDLASGQHRNPTARPGYFTTAYFHQPEELAAEVRAAGLAVVAELGVEGPANWLVPDFDAWWDDPARREQLLDAARAVEVEPSLRGLGPHLMVVATRPG